MKTILTIEKEFDLKILTLKAEVRYWEDSEINDIQDSENGDLVPCKNGDNWEPIIEIETGKILNWIEGTKAYIHYKVCDCCGWDIKDINNNVVLSTNDGYVPDCLATDGEGFGDYIIMSINENGIIENWNFDIEDFKSRI